MLEWVTSGPVRAEVQAALEQDELTPKEWAVSRGNAQIRRTATLVDDAAAASKLCSELSIAFLEMVERATRKKGW